MIGVCQLAVPISTGHPEPEGERARLLLYILIKIGFSKTLEVCCTSDRTCRWLSTLLHQQFTFRVSSIEQLCVRACVCVTERETERWRGSFCVCLRVMQTERETDPFRSIMEFFSSDEKYGINRPHCLESTTLNAFISLIF